MTTWDRVAPLESQEQVSGFKSGLDSVDEWVSASAYSYRRYVATHLCCSGDVLIAFFALKNITIETDGLSSKIRGLKDPEGRIQALLLCQMGVDLEHQGEGNGLKLFVEAVRKAIEAYEISKVPLLVVDAATDRLVDWYQDKCGMTRIPGTRRLVALIPALQKALA
ncbi:hypothetical protein [Pseudoclavibacter sp. VKM Ac-2867]|uniref:hypothetical protein n=1 Tax=Pseudoclavibacter sp. VKM Ac-2867 TaxID=2783829 RepID=UPI00188CBB2D|nr:hypothetical protein [Pseudoclavibacter sp. VKM Ac-2867]MBF4458349.1 hypothetical protein [Pseudoclavibacter sp. VKM Ac-2867]